MRAFEDRFLTIGLPYRVIGGPRFYERQEIRDAMAYFRVAVSPDDGLAFERIVNVPKRGIGDKALQEINRTARDNGVSLVDGAGLLVANGGLPARARAALGQLVDGIDRWHAAIRDRRIDHVELAETILDESGYTDMWAAEKSPDAAGRLENLKELVKALDEFENLQGFLEHVALVMDNEQDEGAPKVSVMTLHAAKGLEFPAVFLPGWEDGLFPSQRSMDESGVKGLEEERRLAYVGITRAQRLCTISFAANRRVYNQWQSQLPSRFIDELPPAHVEVLTPPGLYGGGYGAAAPAPARRSPRTPPRPTSTTPPAGSACRPAPAQRPMSQPQEARNIVIDATAVAGLRPRHPRLPPEVRLRHRHRRRGRQADHRLREGRPQERRRPLRHRRRRRAVPRPVAQSGRTSCVQAGSVGIPPPCWVGHHEPTAVAGVGAALRNHRHRVRIAQPGRPLPPRPPSPRRSRAPPTRSGRARSRRRRCRSTVGNRPRRRNRRTGTGFRAARAAAPRPGRWRPPEAPAVPARSVVPRLQRQSDASRHATDCWGTSLAALSRRGFMALRGSAKSPPISSWMRLASS